MNLITLNQVKMLKSEGTGYLSACLNLEPNFKYAGHNTCPMAGRCAKHCLSTAGRNRFDSAKAARIRRTKLYYDHREVFYAMLRGDLAALEAKAKREGLKPTMRLNCLSDIAWEDDVVEDGKHIFALHPRIQFYDYSKVESRFFKYIHFNYHLTYSASERSRPGFIDRCLDSHAHNVAMVFAGELPKGFRTKGRPLRWHRVIDGDVNDLRFLDPRNRIVGLRYKKAFSNRDGSAFRPVKDTPFIRILEQRA